MPKRPSGKGCSWPIVCKNMISFKKNRLSFSLCLLLCFLQSTTFAENIKQLTVNNYLQQAKAQEKKANNLISETSPYLLQHAYNPVNWYAWGEEAFEKAKKENKPIFLSIGYSTCHWCHVMAHESFENQEIAALLNKHFVSIKVDREQRPDIDSIYMLATELINGYGGWPMTVFLDHNLRPFHAATYYPPFTLESSLGLKEVLLKIHELWIKQPQKIDQVATQVTSAITALADDTVEGGSLVDNVVELAFVQLLQNYDAEWGGFSAAPKFPRYGIFSFLNQLALNAKNILSAKNKKVIDVKSIEKAEQMMKTTLDAMLAGGIYDQLGGGFHRYSVDESWQVPHFEKMLYSQALMIMAYSDYYLINPQEKYKQVVYETLNFVARELQSPQGGYYSALDADSEPVNQPGKRAEGAYYLWSAAELKKVLSVQEFELLKKYYQLHENGNIDSDPQGEFINLNLLFIAEDYREQVLSQQQMKLLRAAKKKLNAIRRQRPRPHLDDKVITAWNGMMLAALAKAAVVFSEPAFLDKAAQSAAYIKAYLYKENSKQLLRVHRDSPFSAASKQLPAASKVENQANSAMLEDYAWLIYGLLEVYQASKNEQWLNWALALQQQQDALFLDAASGAYFESLANDASLLFRSKSIFDGALPSANAVALSNLYKLASLSANSAQAKYPSQANRLVNSFATVVNQDPAAAAMLLSIEINYRVFKPVPDVLQ